MWKKHKIIMLPSHSISAGLCKYYNPDGTENLSIDMDKLQRHTNYHLYVVTENDQIQEGDWCVSLHLAPFARGIYKADKIVVDNAKVGAGDFGKIIASTDRSLNLPLIHTNFTVEYCDLNGIDEVLVEYTHICKDEIGLDKEQLDLFECEKSGDEWCNCSSCSKIVWIPKLNDEYLAPIKIVKQSYTREEVIKLCQSAYESGMNSDETTFNNWLNENL